MLVVEGENLLQPVYEGGELSRKEKCRGHMSGGNVRIPFSYVVRSTTRVIETRHEPSDERCGRARAHGDGLPRLAGVTRRN